MYDIYLQHFVFCEFQESSYAVLRFGKDLTLYVYVAYQYTLQDVIVRTQYKRSVNFENSFIKYVAMSLIY